MASRPSKNLLLQKATERRHIELFLELAGLPARTEFGDRPDCVLVFPGGRIGLEHRELCDQRLLAHGPHLQRFRESARGELEARGLDVRVQVQFPALSTYFLEHPRRVAPLAREIADLAAAAVAPAVVGEDGLRALGIEGPVRVVVQRSGEGPSVQTQSGPADFEAEGAHRLFEAVRSKEAKLSAYACEVSRVWLLLVTGESAAQPAAGIENLHIESRFDRVFVLDARDRRLLCVAAG
ncbi:MAG TPA: hypothetical protein VFL36_11865 [Myxococcales bacterium]|nr:hypothetical protein [Myxococcales bacterium]